MRSDPASQFQLFKSWPFIRNIDDLKLWRTMLEKIPLEAFRVFDAAARASLNLFLRRLRTEHHPGRRQPAHRRAGGSSGALCSLPGAVETWRRRWMASGCSSACGRRSNISEESRWNLSAPARARSFRFAASELGLASLARAAAKDFGKESPGISVRLLTTDSLLGARVGDQRPRHSLFHR